MFDQASYEYILRCAFWADLTSSVFEIYREQSGKSHFSVIFESGNGKGKVGNPTFEFPVAGLPGRYTEGYSGDSSLKPRPGETGLP